MSELERRWNKGDRFRHERLFTKINTTMIQKRRKFQYWSKKNFRLKKGVPYFTLLIWAE